MLFPRFQSIQAAERPVHNDASRQMIFLKKYPVRHGVGLRVVLPAQRQHLQPLVDDVGSVPAHADPVNMVQVCRLAADAALLCYQTVVDVLSANGIRPGDDVTLQLASRHNPSEIILL